MTRADRNAAAIATLHVEYQPFVWTWLAKMEAAHHQTLIVQARRDSALQAKLWAQGRNSAGEIIGPIVTRARPGNSYHEYGLGIDYLDVDEGDIEGVYDQGDWNATEYAEMSAAGVALGMEAGYDWEHQDKPHLEYHPGLGPRDAHVLAKFCNPAGFLPAGFFASRA